MPNSACLAVILGPLTYKTQKGTILVGVVAGSPGTVACMGQEIYGRVSHPNILRWIKKIIGTNY